MKRNRNLKEILQAILERKSLPDEGVLYEELLNNGLEGVFYNLYGKQIKNTPLGKRLEERISFLMARDIHQRKILAEIASALKEKNTEFLLLKGAVLADTLYPPGTRFFEDIDIFVDEKNYERAKNRILNYGFREYVGRNGFIFTPLFKSEILIHRKYDYIQIDLHRSLFSKYWFQMDFDEVYRSSLPFFVDGVEVRKMEPLTEFVYLLLHGAAQHFYRLKGIQILDISLHFRKFQHDMEKVVNKLMKGENHYGGYYILDLLIRNDFIKVKKCEIERIKPDFLSRSLMKLVLSISRENIPQSFFLRAGSVMASLPGISRKGLFIYHYIKRRIDAFLKKSRSRSTLGRIQ